MYNNNNNISFKELDSDVGCCYISCGPLHVPTILFCNSSRARGNRNPGPFACAASDLSPYQYPYVRQVALTPYQYLRQVSGNRNLFKIRMIIGEIH